VRAHTHMQAHEHVFLQNNDDDHAADDRTRKKGQGKGRKWETTLTYLHIDELISTSDLFYTNIVHKLLIDKAQYI